MTKQTVAKIVVILLGVVLIGWLLWLAPFVREGVVMAAGKVGTPAVPFLRMALKDQDHKVREQAIIALRAIGADAVPSLVESLNDEDVSVRSQSAGALRILGLQATVAIPQLLEAVKDPEPQVRFEAI